MDVSEVNPRLRIAKEREQKREAGTGWRRQGKICRKYTARTKKSARLAARAYEFINIF